MFLICSGRARAWKRIHAGSGMPVAAITHCAGFRCADFKFTYKVLIRMQKPED